MLESRFRGVTTGKNEKQTNSAKRALIFLLLVGLVVTLAVLLVGAAGDSQEFLMEFVVNNVDGHPAIEAIVENFPGDCLKCH